VHLVGFIIRIYHDARSAERQNHTKKMQQTFAMQFETQIVLSFIFRVRL